MSEAQLGSAARLDLNLLYQRLGEISKHRNIEHIDIYGGEVGLLPNPYFSEMVQIIRLFYQGPVSVITNLSVMNPWFENPEIDLSISWDYTAREKHLKTFENMKSLSRPFHILCLASDTLLQYSENELDSFIDLLNQLPKLETLEIKPYSLNSANYQKASFLQYEDFIKRWLSRKPSFQFEFINERKIQQSLDREYSAWSDDHLYLTPQGDWTVLEFDSEQKEFFKPVQDYADFLCWAQGEKDKVSTSAGCQDCEYLGHCLSEHLQLVPDRLQSCNGFYNLLKWYQHENA